MKIVAIYSIQNETDLIFAKQDSKKFLTKYDFYESYLLALMEFGTNLYKHGGGGEIWLIENENGLLIASLDKGKGIEDLSWALKKGTSSFKNSLGLGLYSLSNKEGFFFEVFSKPDFGSVFLFGKRDKKDILFLQRPFYNENVTGDFIFKKGKFFIIGDVSGHGIKAYKSACEIKRFFQQEVLSCIVIEDILEKLHNFMKNNNLRSVVLSIVENLKEKINICGVGNINIFYKNFKLNYFTQKNGMIGEIFSSVSKYTFDKKNSLVVLKTDGISDKIVKMFLENGFSKEMIAIASVFYSEKNDDKTILIIGDKNE